MEEVMPLSDTAIRNAKPAAKPYRLFDGGGLYLEVSPSGGKLWRLKYRFDGKEKRLALGKYPEISLKDVRDRRDGARKLLANGVDPGVHRKAVEADKARMAADSFEAVALEWHAMKSKKWAKVTANKALVHLCTYAFPEIGHLPIASIKASVLLDMLRKVEAKGIAYTATRIREMCGQIFRYGVATGRAEDNPAAHLVGALAKPGTTHRPAITERREFGLFLRDLREATGFDQITRHACYFAMLTMVRAQEFRFAKWEEIDRDAQEWKVPARRMKVGKQLPAHTVPLSRQALELLEKLHGLTGRTPYLFPKAKGYGENEVISENTVGKLLNNLGYQGRQCVHGFRASARSILSEQGWSVEAMERQLDHKEADGTVAAYARSQHLPERRRMMQAWADTCDALETGADVVPIHGRQKP
jgi:integrase